MENFLKELYLRVTLKSPVFFKQFRALLLSISAGLTGLVEAGVDFHVLGFDVTKILAILTFGAGIATFFAVKDTEELEKKLDK